MLIKWCKTEPTDFLPGSHSHVNEAASPSAFWSLFVVSFSRCFWNRIFTLLSVFRWALWGSQRTSKAIWRSLKCGTTAERRFTSSRYVEDEPFLSFLPLTGGKYILYIFFCTGYFTFKNTSTQLTVEMNWPWTCRVWTKHHLVRNSCTWIWAVSSIRETSDGLCSDRNMKTVLCIRNLFIWHYWPNNPSDFSEVGTTGRNHLTVSEALFLKTKPRLYVLHFCEHCLQCLQKYTCKHWLRRPRLPALSV